MNTNAVSLEENLQCLEEFNDTLSDVIRSVQSYEDRLASHRALGTSAKDMRHFDKIRVCIDLFCLIQYRDEWHYL